MNTDYFRRIARYIYLRPPLMWTLVSFIVLFCVMLLIRWKESTEFENFDSLETFTVIELRLPDIQKNPDIDIQETKIHEQEPEVKEEIMKFGSQDGSYDNLEEGAQPPRPIFARLPRYPGSMRKAGIEGVVIIELGIDESGSVVYGRIIKSLGKEFDAAVIAWAQKVKFYPAISKLKKPVRCRIRLPIRFKLEN